MGADIVTVSTDTQFVHLAWHEHEKSMKDVKYTMAADPNGKISRLFGVYMDDAGVALRGTFIINPEGVLLGQEVLFLNYGRNIDELMRRFKACLYLTKKSNEACPAKWRDDGDKTLTPGPEMVGRVHEALE